MSDGSAEMQIITSAGTTAAKVFISFEDLIKALVARERKLKETMEYIDQEDHIFDGEETVFIRKLDDTHAAIFRDELRENGLDYKEYFDPSTERYSFEMKKSDFERDPENPKHLSRGETSIHDLCIRGVCYEYAELSRKEYTENLKVETLIASHSTEGINPNAPELILFDINDPGHKYEFSHGMAIEYVNGDKLTPLQLATNDKLKDLSEFREQLKLDMAKAKSNGAVWRVVTPLEYMHIQDDIANDRIGKLKELKDDHTNYTNLDKQTNAACEKIRSQAEKNDCLDFKVGFVENGNWTAEIAVHGEYADIVKNCTGSGILDSSFFKTVDGETVFTADFRERFNKELEINRVSAKLEDEELKPQEAQIEEEKKNAWVVGDNNSIKIMPGAMIDPSINPNHEEFDFSLPKIKKAQKTSLYILGSNGELKINPELTAEQNIDIENTDTAIPWPETTGKWENQDVPTEEFENQESDLPVDRERFDDSNTPVINIDFEQNAIPEHTNVFDTDIDHDDDGIRTR